MVVHKYAKFIVSAVAAIAGSLLTVLGDDAITTQEIITIIVLAVGALGVRQAENKEKKSNGPQQLSSSGGL